MVLDQQAPCIVVVEMYEFLDKLLPADSVK